MEKVEAITKKATSLTPVLFDANRFVSMTPKTGLRRPNKNNHQQSNMFREKRDICEMGGLKTEATGLKRPKQGFNTPTVCIASAV